MSTSTRPARKSWDHGQRRQALAESLLTEIVNGVVRPGEHLVTQALARRFGVSHTPVREALFVLAGMGLLDLAPNRGAVVRRLTERDVREICQVRRALECEAVRLACGQIEPDSLAQLQAELKDLASGALEQPRFIAEARALDSKLHDLIAASSNNTFLMAELGRLKNLFRAFRDAAWNHSESHHDFHRLTAEAHEHLAVVKALAAGERRRAVDAMATHIDSGMTYWCRALPEGPTPRKQYRGKPEVGNEGD